MSLFAAIKAAGGKPRNAKEMEVEQAQACASWTPDVGFASKEEADWTSAVAQIVEMERPSGLAPLAEIIPGFLFLSGMAAATNRKTLESGQITHVLNCTGEALEYPTDVSQLVLEGAADAGGYPLLQLHFERARAFIDEARQHASSRVLVHCRMGKNRSAAIVAAYMIAAEKVPLLEAVQRVFNARPIVLSNQTFQRDLVRLAEKEGMLMHRPADHNARC